MCFREGNFVIDVYLCEEEMLWWVSVSLRRRCYITGVCLLEEKVSWRVCVFLRRKFCVGCVFFRRMY